MLHFVYIYIIITVFITAYVRDDLENWAVWLLSLLFSPVVFLLYALDWGFSYIHKLIKKKKGKKDGDN